MKILKLWEFYLIIFLINILLIQFWIFNGATLSIAIGSFMMSLYSVIKEKGE